MNDETAPRVAVFGSVNMDLVAYVDTRPGSGQTVTGTEFRQVPGGKGANQAIAAARVGGDVSFFGAVGDDAFGAQLRHSLVESGIEISGLRTKAGVSGVAHIAVEGDGANSIIHIPGANGHITGLSDDDIRLIRGSSALLLQLELPLPAVTAAARAGREVGVPTVLTPAPVQALPDALLDAVDLMVANEHEAEEIAGDSDPSRALDLLLERVPEVVITLGARGAVHGRRGADPVRVPARRVTAVDTTAAGDVFCGALTVARAEGQATEASLRFAAEAAALSVQRHGASVSMPYRAEIDEHPHGTGTTG